MKLLMLVDKKGNVNVQEANDLQHKYHEMFKALENILEMNPRTWKKYEGEDECCDEIINMEITELMKAKESENLEEIENEYLHCAAAFLNAYISLQK